MSYESPIRLITDEYALKLIEDEEQNIVKAVCNYGIDIDKDELVKLIHNDRKQYDKGYADGWRDMKKSLVRCGDCKHRGTTNCTSYNAFWELGDDGFCSVGERKKE